MPLMFVSRILNWLIDSFYTFSHMSWCYGCICCLNGKNATKNKKFSVKCHFTEIKEMFRKMSISSLKNYSLIRFSFILIYQTENIKGLCSSCLEIYRSRHLKWYTFNRWYNMYEIEMGSVSECIHFKCIACK